MAFDGASAARDAVSKRMTKTKAEVFMELAGRSLDPKASVRSGFLELSELSHTRHFLMRVENSLPAQHLPMCGSWLRISAMMRKSSRANKNGRRLGFMCGDGIA